MYGNFGIDDEKSYDLFKDFYNGLLGDAPNPTDEGFQAQQVQVPELAQGLLDTGGVTQQLQDMGANGSDIAEQMAQTAQQMPAGNGQNRIAQQQQANQAAMQQSQQKGGGLLSGLFKIGANALVNNWIGGMFPKKG